mmetsp:Transcript_23018/g.46522  ORF Transcript_23018/g.46522 Transcript_23018/m.46522 type:complete len:145 (+) Transcript_23018:220-654(+)
MPQGSNKVDFLSKASLPLQILIFFNGCYDFLFFVATLAIFIWKGVELPYPRARYGPEIVLVFAYMLVEIMRLFLGSKGNKTEHAVTLIAFLVLCIFSVLANVFLLVWQTYVLRLDLILNLISVVFVALEALAAIFAILRFSAGR